MQDIAFITKELISLIKEKKTEVAAEKLDKALRNYGEAGFGERTKMITAINRNILSIRKQQEALWHIASTLPNDERTFVEHQIKNVIDKIFNDKISQLKKNKRNFSKPR